MELVRTVIRVYLQNVPFVFRSIHEIVNFGVDELKDSLLSSLLVIPKGLGGIQLHRTARRG
jgi:hypothetical protein